MVDAVPILGSAAFLATAAQIAASPLEDAAAHVQLAYIVSENLWGVGALFFGLWLIPMGACVLLSKSMPRALGWSLIVGAPGIWSTRSLPTSPPTSIRYLKSPPRSSHALCSSAASARGGYLAQGEDPVDHHAQQRPDPVRASDGVQPGSPAWPVLRH